MTVALDVYIIVALLVHSPDIGRGLGGCAAIVHGMPACGTCGFTTLSFSNFINPFKMLCQLT